MKEILLIIDKPYSYCSELKDYILENTVYKDLGFMPPARGELFEELIENKVGYYFVATAKPNVARDLKLYFEDSEEINIKLILICTDEVQDNPIAKKAGKNSLCISAIERLSVEGLNKLLNDVAVDVLFDGRGSFKNLQKQFDKYLNREFVEKQEHKKEEEISIPKSLGDIVYKCCFVESRVKQVVELGCKKFEIHTDDRLLCDPDFVKSAIDMLDSFPDIVTIHTPLDPTFAVLDEQSCTVSGVINSRATRCAVKKCMKIAQACADKYKHRVGIVIHNMDTIEQLLINGDNKKLIRAYTKLLNKYPDVDIYIENTTPSELNINGCYKFHDGILEDVPVIVQLLNTHICKNRINRFYTCLDTCHMLSTIRIHKALNLPMKYTMTEFFKLYGDTCAQLHFSYCKNFGHDMGEHGIGFQNNVNYLKEWLGYINTFMPSANIVLEMYEKDYLNPVNSLHAAKLIEKYRNEQ